MKLEVGSYAYVGGCVGQVTRITNGDKRVEVRGIYIDVITGEPDPWHFLYENVDVETLTLVKWKRYDGKDIFDLSNHKRIVKL